MYHQWVDDVKPETLMRSPNEWRTPNEVSLQGLFAVHTGCDS